MDLCDFLNALVGADKEAAIDLVLDFFNDGISNYEFVLCSGAMKLLPVEQLHPSVLVSVLGITHKAARYLPDYNEFWDKVFAQIRYLKGRRYAKQLLDKYLSI